ncbi:MAG: hypothetical protein RL260_2361, partial [Pseudomonadota bacterium]
TALNEQPRSLLSRSGFDTLLGAQGHAATLAAALAALAALAAVNAGPAGSNPAG